MVKPKTFLILIVLLIAGASAVVDFVRGQFGMCNNDLLARFEQLEIAQRYELIYTNDLHSDGYEIADAEWHIERNGNGCVVTFVVLAYRFSDVRRTRFHGDSFFINVTTNTVYPQSEGSRLILEPYGGYVSLRANQSGGDQGRILPTPRQETTHVVGTATIHPNPFKNGTAVPTISTFKTPEMTLVSAPANCKRWAEISLQNFGQEECVYGFVMDVFQNDQAYFITFGDGDSDFYFLSYDLYFPDVKKGACIMTTGKIERLGDNPVIVLTRRTKLYNCSNK